jgi:hypothetical protein
MSGEKAVRDIYKQAKAEERDDRIYGTDCLWHLTIKLLLIRGAEYKIQSTLC